MVAARLTTTLRREAARGRLLSEVAAIPSATWPAVAPFSLWREPLRQNCRAPWLDSVLQRIAPSVSSMVNHNEQTHLGPCRSDDRRVLPLEGHGGAKRQ